MSRPPNAQLSHIGFQVRDLENMIAFYTRVLGLVVTDRGPYRLGGEIVFMSATPKEHHQIVLVSGRQDSHASIVNQISFHVDTLEDLRRFHAVLVREQVKELAPRDHGNAWSIYFHDPEGNRLELYTATPWYVAQPYGKDLDLTQPAEAIMAKTEAMVRAEPTLMPREAWARKLEGTLAGG